MRRQPRFPLVAVMFVVLASPTACSTSSHRVGPSHDAIQNHDIEVGDRVLIRYASATNAKVSDRSQEISIIKIDDEGIFGTDQAGYAVFVGFDEIFEIEFKKAGRFDSDKLTNSGASKAASKLTYYGFCVLLALGFAECPDPD